MAPRLVAVFAVTVFVFVALRAPTAAQGESPAIAYECALWLGEQPPYTAFPNGSSNTFPNREAVAVEVDRRGGDYYDYSTIVGAEEGCPEGFYELVERPCDGIGDVCYGPVRVGTEDQGAGEAAVSRVSAAPTNLPRTGSGSGPSNHASTLFLAASLLALCGWRATRVAR